MEAGIDLIQHPEVLTSEMSDALVDEIARRGTVCAMLSNTITGDAWQEHLEAQKKRRESESEEPP